MGNRIVDEEFRSKQHRKCYYILQHRLFEAGLGLAILFNLVIVTIETDALASDTSVPIWVDVLSWVILSMFLLEIGGRLFVYKWDFFLDTCNSLDFLIVVSDVVLNIIGLVASAALPVSFLRVIRLFKLLRVSKAFRVFPELRLLASGLAGAVKAICWGTVILAIAIFIAAVLGVQLIHPLNERLSHDADCGRCPHSYSNVFNACVTLVQQAVIGDNWGETSIPLIEQHPLTALYFMYAYVSIALATLNLILGVVVDVAIQARNQMSLEIDNEQVLEEMESKNHLLTLCKNMDEDQSGQLSHEELAHGYAQNEEFRNILIEMDIFEEDLEVLFHCLDADRSGTINYSEFVTSCHKLKTSDVQMMLNYIKYYVIKIKGRICDEIKEVKKEMNAVGQNIGTLSSTTEGFFSEAMVEEEEKFSGFEPALKELASLDGRLIDMLAKLESDAAMKRPVETIGIGDVGAVDFVKEIHELFSAFKTHTVEIQEVLMHICLLSPQSEMAYAKKRPEPRKKMLKSRSSPQFGEVLDEATIWL
jgi:hypothetical protein